MESLIRFKTNIDFYITFLWIEWLKRRIYLKREREKEFLSSDFM